MNIFTYLKNDHQKVADLFEKLSSQKEKQSMQEIYLKIKEELTLHADPEKETFYVALKAYHDEEDAQHGEEEHIKIKAGMKKIDKLKAGTTAWIMAVGELKEIVTHHVDDEENKMFPLAKKLFPKELAIQLVVDMQAKKEKMKASASFFKKLKSFIVGDSVPASSSTRKKSSATRKPLRATRRASTLSASSKGTRATRHRAR